MARESGRVQTTHLRQGKKNLKGEGYLLIQIIFFNDKWTFPAEDTGAVEVHEQRGTNQRQKCQAGDLQRKK